MSRARFVAEARREFLAQIIYYNSAEPGLGRRFTAAVERASSLALAFPEAGSPAYARTRRVVVNGFPFSIFYRPAGTDIVIFAVAHHAQRPNYWRSRTKRR